MLAERLNIDTIKVRGAYGLIEGSVFDTIILPAYATSGKWAHQATTMVADFFATRGGGTYVDVGANIGLTLIPVAQNPDVACLAIEPDPRNYKYLVANVAANCPHGNVTAKQIALHSGRATLSLELAPDNHGDHRIRLTDAPGKSGEQFRRTIEVEAAPLDEIMPAIQSPLVIKIDTQGAEPLVIAGGKGTLTRAELMVMEFWPYGMARLGENPFQLIEWVKRNFAQAAIAEGEPWADVTFHSINEAAAILQDIVERSGDDAQLSVDIIARK